MLEARELHHWWSLVKSFRHVECMWVASGGVGPMHRTYGTLDAELEVQHPIKRAELTAFLCLVRTTTAYVVNKWIIGRNVVHWSGSEGRWHVDFDVEEVPRVYQDGTILMSSVSRHFAPSKRSKTCHFFEWVVTDENGKSDGLAKDGIWLDGGEMEQKRASAVEPKGEEVDHALQHAAGTHCLFEGWRGCEEHNAKTKGNDGHCGSERRLRNIVRNGVRPQADILAWGAAGTVTRGRCQGGVWSQSGFEWNSTLSCKEKQRRLWKGTTWYEEGTRMLRPLSGAVTVRCMLGAVWSWSWWIATDHTEKAQKNLENVEREKRELLHQEAQVWNTVGEKRSVTRKECKRAKEAVRVLERQKEDARQWSIEERRRRLVGEYKAMHVKLLSSWLREEKDGKAKEVE